METDWRKLVERDDIDLIDIGAPAAEVRAKAEVEGEISTYKALTPVTIRSGASALVPVLRVTLAGEAFVLLDRGESPETCVRAVNTTGLVPEYQREFDATATSEAGFAQWTTHQWGKNQEQAIEEATSYWAPFFTEAVVAAAVEYEQREGAPADPAPSGEVTPTYGF